MCVYILAKLEEGRPICCLLNDFENWRRNPFTKKSPMEAIFLEKIGASDRNRTGVIGLENRDNNHYTTLALVLFTRVPALVKCSRICIVFSVCLYIQLLSSDLARTRRFPRFVLVLAYVSSLDFRRKLILKKFWKI